MNYYQNPIDKNRMRALSKLQKLPEARREEVLDLVDRIDPTSQTGHVYVGHWILRLVLSGNILEEDADGVREWLEDYFLVSATNPAVIQNHPLSKKGIKTKQELFRLVSRLLPDKYALNVVPYDLPGVVEFQNVPHPYRILKCEGLEAVPSVNKLAEGTGWCTIGEDQAIHYLKENPLIIILKDDTPLAQAHIGLRDGLQVKDIDDEDVDGTAAEPEVEELLKGIRFYERAFTYYERRLTSSSVEVRRQAIAGLGHLGSPEAINLLRRIILIADNYEGEWDTCRHDESDYCDCHDEDENEDEESEGRVEPEEIILGKEAIDGIVDTEDIESLLWILDNCSSQRLLLKTLKEGFGRLDFGYSSDELSEDDLHILEVQLGEYLPSKLISLVLDKEVSERLRRAALAALVYQRGLGNIQRDVSPICLAIMREYINFPLERDEYGFHYINGIDVNSEDLIFDIAAEGLTSSANSEYNSELLEMVVYSNEKGNWRFREAAIKAVSWKGNFDATAALVRVAESRRLPHNTSVIIDALQAIQDPGAIDFLFINLIDGFRTLVPIACPSNCGCYDPDWHKNDAKQFRMHLRSLERDARSALEITIAGGTSFERAIWSAERSPNSAFNNPEYTARILDYCLHILDRDTKQPPQDWDERTTVLFALKVIRESIVRGALLPTGYDQPRMPPSSQRDILSRIMRYVGDAIQHPPKKGGLSGLSDENRIFEVSKEIFHLLLRNHRVMEMIKDPR